MTNYGVYYRGMLATRTLTRSKAEAYAYKQAKDKAWEVKDIEVRELTQNLNLGAN